MHVVGGFFFFFFHFYIFDEMHVGAWYRAIFSLYAYIYFLMNACHCINSYNDICDEIQLMEHYYFYSLMRTCSSKLKKSHHIRSLSTLKSWWWRVINDVNSALEEVEAIFRLLEGEFLRGFKEKVWKWEPQVAVVESSTHHTAWCCVAQHHVAWRSIMMRDAV